jgi:hypothetical protein
MPSGYSSDYGGQPEQDNQPTNQRDRSEGVVGLPFFLSMLLTSSGAHPIAEARERFAAHAHNGNWLSITSSASFRIV